MADDTKVACNRIPFLSDDTCDRGDVDINAFNEFPICKLIDPTTPDSATPQADFPVIPFTPPPCSCVDVAIVSRSVGVTPASEPSLSVDFKSVGDCCEGKYVSYVDLQVPCMPFDISGGDTPHPISITTRCSDTAIPSGSFNLGLKKSGDCALTVSPKIKLDIPRPPSVDFDMSVDVSQSSCTSSPTGSVTISKTEENCKKTFKPQLKLSVPKFPDIKVCEGSVSLSGGLGKLSSGSISGISSTSCSYTICPDIDINIPCPISAGSIVMETKLGWDKQQTGSAILASLSECSIVPYSGSIDIGLPCPLPDKDIEVLAKPKWINKKEEYKNYTILKKVKDNCKYEKPPSIDLEIRCPLPNEDYKLSIKPKWKDNIETTEYTFAKKTDDCRFEKPGDINLELRCPLPNEDYKIKFKPTYACHDKEIGYEDYTILKKDTDSCRFIKPEQFNLNLPCVLKNITLKSGGKTITPTWGTGSSCCSPTWDLGNLDSCYCIKYVGTDGSWGTVSNCCNCSGCASMHTYGCVSGCHDNCSACTGEDYCKTHANRNCGCLDCHREDCGCQVVSFENLLSGSGITVHIVQKPNCQVEIHIGQCLKFINTDGTVTKIGDCDGCATDDCTCGQIINLISREDSNTVVKLEKNTTYGSCGINVNFGQYYL